MPSQPLNYHQITEVGRLMNVQAGGGEEQASRQDEGMQTTCGQHLKEDSLTYAINWR